MLGDTGMDVSQQKAERMDKIFERVGTWAAGCSVEKYALNNWITMLVDQN